MKSVIFCFFLFVFAGINAQEIKSEDNTVNSNTTIVNSKQTNKSTPCNKSLENDVCLAEQSKFHFYKALIRQNNLEEELSSNKKSIKVALKSTEDIIKKNKNRVSYSE